VTLSIISGIRKALGDNAKIGYLRPVTILQEQEDHHQQLKQQHEGPKTHLEQEEGNEDDSPLVCKYLYSLNENQSSPSSSVVQILDDGTVHTPSHSTPTSSELQSNRLRHLENIRTSYENLADDVDILVIQGAGHHAAVGTFAGMGNARMARNLGGSVVLVGGGGIGATFDELEVNRVLCQVYNVPISGVVLNKVQADKVSQTSRYLGRAFSQWWSVPLLGCIPNDRELLQPTLHDLESLFETSLVSGSKSRFRRYDVKRNMAVVTTSLTWFLDDICCNREEDENQQQKDVAKRKLYVCHGSRDDIVLGFLAEYQRRKNIAREKGFPSDFESALVICGRGDDNEDGEADEPAVNGNQWGKGIVSDEVRDLIRAMDGTQDDDGDGGVPILLTKHSTHVTSELIRAFKPRLSANNTDEESCDRVDRVIDHCERFLDIDELLKRNLLVEEYAGTEDDLEEVAR